MDPWEWKILPKNVESMTCFMVSDRIQVWYIYIYLVDLYGRLVGKYTVRPMDAMGFGLQKVVGIQFHLPLSGDLSETPQVS